MIDHDHLKGLVKQAEEIGAEHFESDAFNQPPGLEVSEASEEFEHVYGDKIDSLLEEGVVPWGAVALRAHELAE